MHASACGLAEPAAKPRVQQAWLSVLQHVARAEGVQAGVLSQLRLTGHADRHVFPVWAAKFNWSLPAREEIGRWAGDVVLLAGEERDTRQRSQRAI